MQRKFTYFIGALICSFLFICTTNITTQVRLPKLISDGMVLQRDVDLQIWGWAAPYETVQLDFMGNLLQTNADDSGQWSFTLPPTQAGGPYKMRIIASTEVEINNILIGDVWVFSGQSNMELPMRRVSWIYPYEVKNSDFPEIRQFMVPQTYNFNEKLSDFNSGKWVVANPGTIMNFSAVAWFYAHELYQRYNVPQGLIVNALGGSPAEAWLSESALRQFPAHYDEMQRFKSQSLIDSITQIDNDNNRIWHAELNRKDIGVHNRKGHWSNPKTNVKKWQSMPVPQMWQNTELEHVNGSIWFRHEFVVPDAFAGNPAQLLLGCIVDADSVFINGKFVGTTGYQYPPRRYNVPDNLLKKGKNIITIRVLSQSGTGGFVPDKDYALVSGNDTLDLSGNWRYKVGAVMPPHPGQTFVRWKPGGLYNAMLNPLFNYQIKGILWYQGESNTSRAYEYASLFPALIENWRQGWNNPELPFIYVQLANFMKGSTEPEESGWPHLRDVQRRTLSVDGTAMVVTIDLGEWNDIHPLNKKDVGKRLALAAMHTAHNEKDHVHSGPLYKSHEIDGKHIIISFENTGSGLTAKGGDQLNHFAIADESGIYRLANAKIDGDKVVVWHNDITHPVAVRYAWANNPIGANLYNQEGLPASPFSTEQ